MKIIKTRKRTEIEITLNELRGMLHDGGDQMAKCASEILRALKEVNYPKHSVGIDEGKKDGDKSCMVICSTSFKPNPLHFAAMKFKPIFKTDKDIRNEERKKVIEEVLEYFNHQFPDMKLGNDCCLGFITVDFINKIKKLERK